jgi:RimK family alpha-L-glutamate ligase
MTDRFSDYIGEAKAKKKAVVFAFGRLNPPTIGHGVLVDKVMSEAAKRDADHFVFVTKTTDPKKNPLTHEQKVSYLRKFFPKGNFPLNKARDLYDCVLYLCSLGYTELYAICGSDRKAEFEAVARYKGKVATKDPKKRKYSFDKYEVVMAGEARDDAAQGTKGMSASKMRAAAFKGDYKEFSQGVPGSDEALKKRLYRDVRKGMSLKEEYLWEATGDEKDKVTILALTSSEKDLSDSVEKMEKICKRRKIEFYAVKTSKAQVQIDNVVSKKIVIKNYDGEGKDATIVPGNTVCIVRGGVMNTQTGVAVLDILQNNGVFMINEKGGMELCANKLQTAIALKKHELPHPRTAFVVNEANIETAVKEIGGKFPVIAKTLTGAEGIGVSKIESMESLKSVLQTLWKYGAEVIIQEFLPDFKNDVRSIVLNGKIFACAKRDKAPKDFRTNIARGSKGGSHQLTDEEIKLVERAARVSKCYYVGIDHVINDGKPYIIEMNASPGSGNIYYRYYEEGKGKDNVKGDELIEDFLDYILNKAHWKLFSNLAVREPVVIDGAKYTAKVDTGNSGYNMIHGENIKDNGDHTVTFILPNGKKVTKKIVSRITVKSGIGEKTRMVILMDIEFHGKKFTNIKFSIGDRSHMSTKVLLGLQFLSKTGFTVDPAGAIYPQPDGDVKRRDDEEEEEELSEVIRHVGGKWVIFSKDGKKKLGTYDTETAAKKRLKQIEFFKRQEGLEEYADVILESMSIKDAMIAVKNFLKSPFVVGKVVDLIKRRKTMEPAKFKTEVELVKQEILHAVYMMSASGMTLAAFFGEHKIGKLAKHIAKELVAHAVVKHGKLPGVDPSAVLTTISSMLSGLGTMLGMGDEVEGDPIIEADLAFKGKKMKGHLDGLLAKIKSKHGTTDVTYSQAMKTVGSTGAARLAARGKIKKDSGEREKGELGKSESVDIEEADVTKGKKFKTKSGKTKESPKDKDSGLPKKYVSGLSKKKATARAKALERRKKMPDSDPRTWEFVTKGEKKMKTKPSKYTSLYNKLKAKGKLKVSRSEECETALSRIESIQNNIPELEARITEAVRLENTWREKGMTDVASLVREYIDFLKEERYEDVPVEDINDEFRYFLMKEEGIARARLARERVKDELKEQYGDDWRKVYAKTLMRMNGSETLEEWLDEAKKVNSVMKWTALGKRGPLLIGTKKIVNTYKQDTPGERERLGEENDADKERADLYKRWRSLVNMGPKELSNFIDSDEGKEAGLSRKEAGKAGAGGGKIKSGRDSARAIVRMLGKNKDSWSDNDWAWAGRQVNFISRMKGAKGPLRDEKGRPTRKLLALKIWGHDPE